MDLKQALIDSSGEVLPMFGLQPVFLGDTVDTQLVSASQVNILIGLNGGLKGNVVIGLNKPTAFRIVSAMAGGMQINALDVITKSALGEISNMIGGSAVGKLQEIGVVNFSPPTLVTGERLFLLISRNKSTKLSFKLDNEVFNISFSLE